MHLNLNPTDQLASLFRQRRIAVEEKSVPRRSIRDAEASGWQVKRVNKTSVRIRRAKAAETLLRDRVWSLLYRLGFSYLSGESGVEMVNANCGIPQHHQLAAVDPEVALAVFCKAFEDRKQWRKLDALVDQTIASMSAFSRGINAEYLSKHPREAVMVLFTGNVHIPPAQRDRLSSAGVVHFNNSDLDYYEKLTAHIGAAAKYQLFADMLPGVDIPGLSIMIPAIRSRIGPHNCYTFSISPAHLQKISFISHRSKGKASDVKTYQRMLTRARLNEIRDYISNDGIFPTNIVLNLESSKVKFKALEQPHSGEVDGGVLGLLEIQPAYKTAWIIDGQHRLFAYSGHPLAASSRLSVLAFEGLPSSTQAKLFIDINAKQKSVKQALLQELYADLKWDADDPSSRVGAIISRAIQELGMDPESPFSDRIQTSDTEKNANRCISLPSLFNGLEKGGFFIVRSQGSEVIEYGPLGNPSPTASLHRTLVALNAWFGEIQEAVSEWWALGSAPGGGIAMNDGVTALINVLRSVYGHLESGRGLLWRLSDEEIVTAARPYARALGAHLASLAEEDRKRFRELRGNQGLAVRTRRLQAALREVFPEYDPAGLDEFLDLEKKETNAKAKEIIDRLELGLKSLVVDVLTKEYGSDWWTRGVKKEIRVKVTRASEEDDMRRGDRDAYFDLIDYRSIAQGNWPLFDHLLTYRGRGKEAGTAWINQLNDKRRIVAHASSGKTVTLPELALLEEYDQWFRGVMEAYKAGAERSGGA